MNSIECILKRRSIRKYKNINVSDEDVKVLLEAAMAAPSARNQQPWEFYVIRNVDVLNKIRSIGRNFDFNSNLMIVVCGNTSRSITQNDNDFWIQDCSAAVENILLAAEELGLGSVWCGLYPVVERANAVKELIEAEDNIIPMALIHIGYPDEEKEPRTQYKEEYVHYIK